MKFFGLYYAVDKVLKLLYTDGSILLLLFSAFLFNHGLPQRIMFLHSVLFSMSFSLAPTSPISSFTTSKNLLFSLPLFLFPSNSISIALLSTYSWSFLMLCPYQLSLPSLIFIPNRSTLTVPLIYSFLIFLFFFFFFFFISIFILLTRRKATEALYIG